jgi:AhpC/TSA antioxidant enzyme
MSAPDTLHRIKRKPPPFLDISDRYPSPDPSDPFAPLWALRSRTSSGLSRHDVPEPGIVNRARSASYLYSTTTAPVSLNTPASSPKLGHSSPHSQTTLFDSPQAFPSISSPLASQPDLHYREQPFADPHTNIRSRRRTYDLNDNTSTTESDTASVAVHNTTFSQSKHTRGSKYRFPKLLLLKKTSFLGSGNRSSIIQTRKSTVPPPVVSTVTWIHSDSINSRSTSKFTASLSPDISNQNHHHHHNEGHSSVPSDGRENLKNDLPYRLPSISISSKMLRKRTISLSMPFSSADASRKRSSSSSSYINISMPTPFPQSTSEDAYTSPRKAPVPPSIAPSTIQVQLPNECPDKSCRLGYNCIHSISSSEWGLPSLLQLNYAACLPITGENGERITFGSLFKSQRTIVIFIRHFWCPLCQDYMSSVNSFIRPEMVCSTCDSESGDYHHPSHEETIRGTDHNNAGTRIRFVVISNGAPGMIVKYRQIFGLSFKMYTDPSLAVYQALGMGRDGGIKHHNQQIHKHSSLSVSNSSGVMSEENSDINKPGGYVKHSLMGGIAMVVVRALKVGMPVWEKGGDIGQLGGEFVFGPG